MQHLVFVGNCQMEVLCNLYKRFAWNRRECRISYIPSYNDLSVVNRRILESADILVEQLLDVAEKVDAATVYSSAQHVKVPVVAANFYWPFAGQPHPLNSSHPFLPSGPFPAESGINFLNRKILEGADPESAVDELMELDVPAKYRLDRLLELTIDRQRRRDELTGFQIADLIEKYYAEEHIFLSSYHPNTRITLALASQTFSLLDVGSADIERLNSALRRSPFPQSEVPIHPRVAGHLGLKFVGPGHRFNYMSDGAISFRDYAIAYMRYTWNRELEEGIAIARQDVSGKALPLVAAGLTRAPNSAPGHEALALAYHQVGRRAEAIASMRRAIELDAGMLSARIHLGKMLADEGEFEAAVEELRQAVALDPYSHAAIGLLGRLLLSRGCTAEAKRVFEQGLASDPREPSLYIELGHSQFLLGDMASAEEAFRAALHLEPSVPGFVGLARVLRACSSTAADVVAQMRPCANASISARAEALLTLWKALTSLGETAGAAEIVRETISALFDYARALEAAGKIGTAVEELQNAVEVAPSNLEARIRLAELLLHLSRFDEARTDIDAALNIAPNNAHVHFLHGIVLIGLGRYQEAVKARRRAVQIEPTAYRHLQLGHALIEAGDWGAAEETIRWAIRLSPETPTFPFELSGLLVRQGRLVEALELAERALKLSPDVAIYHAHLGYLLHKNGQLTDSESEWRKAVMLEPENEHFRSNLETLMRIRTQEAANARDELARS